MQKVSINRDIARKIAAIAARRQVKVETVVNEILQSYLTGQPPVQKQRDTEFLLSIAGMFDSGINDTSERVPAVITDQLLKKHKLKNSNDRNH